jgi:homogentisate 1,2-dioxygenase
MWVYAGLRGRIAMTNSDLVRIEVQGADILVAMRGTCFRVKYRKQEAPWLIAQEYGPDDPDAMITLSEFRALAWAAATDKARELGWLA